MHHLAATQTTVKTRQDPTKPNQIFKSSFRTIQCGLIAMIIHVKYVQMFCKYVCLMCMLSWRDGSMQNNALSNQMKSNANNKTNENHCIEW